MRVRRIIRCQFAWRWLANPLATVLLLCLAAPLAVPAHAQASQLVGTWTGIAEYSGMPGEPPPATFTFQKEKGGTGVGGLVSIPTLNLSNVKLESVRLTGTTVQFEGWSSKKTTISFRGGLSGDNVLGGFVSVTTLEPSGELEQLVVHVRLVRPAAASAEVRAPAGPGNLTPAPGVGSEASAAQPPSVPAGNESAGPVALEGQDYALLFGVDDYTNWPHLDRPLEDVTLIEGELKRHYGYNVIDTVLVQNQQDIWRGLAEAMSKNFKPQDQLLIYYSGHGYYNHGKGTEGGGYLVPPEASSLAPDGSCPGCISEREFLEKVDQINAQHILLVFDACQLGGLLDERSEPRATSGPTGPIDVMLSAAKVVLDKDRTRMAITCGGKQDCFADGGSSNQASPFVQGFLNFLEVRDVRTRSELELYSSVYASVRTDHQTPGWPTEGRFGKGSTPRSNFYFFYDGRPGRQSVKPKQELHGQPEK